MTRASDPSSFVRAWCSSRASRERSSFGSRFHIKPAGRPCVHGKFLFVGDEKLYIRGVTTERSGRGRTERGTRARRSRADFAAMAANGFNAVRLYSVPPVCSWTRHSRHGLRVMIGLPVGALHRFLAEKKKARTSRRRTRRRPAPPPAISRAVLRRGQRDSRFAGRAGSSRDAGRALPWSGLYCAREGRGSPQPVTYVNYPSTEYLRLSS